MRSNLSFQRNWLASVLTLTALGAAGSALACKTESGRDPASALGGDATAAGCPTAVCLTPEPSPINQPPDCTPIPGHTPLFLRWPTVGSIPLGTGYNPMIQDAACYGLVKRATALPNGNKYIFLSNFGSQANGFFRATSTETSMGTVWSPLGVNPVFKKFSGSWFQAIKCPDPHYFSGSGRMHMYFNAIGVGIGYAYSDDEGRSWRSPAATNPILTTSQAWETNINSATCNQIIENPSVLEYQTSFGGTNYNYLMVYTGGDITDCGQIGMAYSVYPDRGWVKRPEDLLLTDPDNPILRVGGDGAWDDATVARPRLVADPCDPDVIHIFYSGAAEGTGCSRRARIGHAYSTDRGQTWVKDFTHNPVLDYASDPNDWDFGTTAPYCADFVTSDDQQFLQMYFLSMDGTGTQGLMMARAPWSSIPPACAPPRAAAENGSLERGVSRSPEPADSRLSLAISPNPAQDAMTLRFALSEGAEISLRIYDVGGRLVAEPARGWRGAGTHEVSLNRGSMAFGRYTAVLEGGGERTSRDLTWIR